MDMGVAGSFVVDGKISAHPLVHKVVLYIGPDKGKLLFSCQLAGQGRLHLAGKLAVPRLFDLLHTVPEGRAVCKLRRGVGGQHNFRMDNTGFSGVVMGYSIPFICQLRSAAVGGCGNGRPALAALDDTDGDMTEIYGGTSFRVGYFRLRVAGQTRSGCLAARGAQGVWGV